MSGTIRARMKRGVLETWGVDLVSVRKLPLWQKC
jgi:hypothetical protein